MFQKFDEMFYAEVQNGFVTLLITGVISLIVYKLFGKEKI